MKSVINPVGSKNDQFLKRISEKTNLTVIAWGINGRYLDRDKIVLPLLLNVHYLKLTQEGFPQHLLYLKNDLKPKVWEFKCKI